MNKFIRWLLKGTWWVVLVIIGYAINETLDAVREKADVTAIQEPLTKDNFDLHFPVSIINTGDKPLSDVQTKVRTCYMNDYKELPTIPILEKGAVTSLKFSERKTMSMITKKLCLVEYNFSFNNCQIETYILNSTTLYTPETTCSVYICDFCPYSIKINSSDLEEEKQIEGWFVSPKEIKLKLTPKNSYPDVDVNKLSKFSPIGFNLFVPFELCLYNETCPFYSISNKVKNKESALYSHLLQQLYPFNVTFVAPPNEELYNYSNVTVHITYTKEQEKEILENALNIDLGGYEIRSVEVVRETS